MSRKASLVFFGNERLATAVTSQVPTLKALVDACYEIKAVIANHQDPVSRQKRDLEIGLLAHSYGIPVILRGQELSLAEKVSRHQADIGILVAYGRLIPNEVIELFPHGIVNIHPSLLPKLRGPTPIEETILSGLTETGVSLMQVSPEMDAGPIYAQLKTHLNGSETKQGLADKLGQLGAELLLDKLPGILAGNLRPEPQNPAMASHTRLIEKADGQVDWSESAKQIERQVRAYAGWPKSRANIHKHDVILTKVRLADGPDDGSLVCQTGDGWLEIQNLIAPSGRQMSGSDFLRGYVKNN